MGRGRANGNWSRSQGPTQGADYPSPVGIYGWRKRCLYLFVLILMVILIINISLTVWILKVMDFTVYGMGKLRITPSGIRVEGDVEFLKPVYTSHIKSTARDALVLESSRNITMHTRDRQGNVTNRLYIGDKKVEALCEKFEVKSPGGAQLFYADKNGVIVGAEKLKIAGAGGAEFAGSVQTPKIVAQVGHELNLRSTTRSVLVTAAQKVRLSSPAGDIKLSALNIKLQAKDDAIRLNSSNIQMKNLPISIPTSGGRSFPGVYQLCICAENGRLFIAPPNMDCKANVDICT